jgi:uncharacterized phage infection (PIP) family protein YhgE
MIRREALSRLALWMGALAALVVRPRRADAYYYFYRYRYHYHVHLARRRFRWRRRR